MKKIAFCLGLGALLMNASCKKDTVGLSDNSWSVSGKVFNATTVSSSFPSNYITAADGKGSSLDFVFKTLPKANTDYTVKEVAYTATDVSVRTVLSGNIVYNSIDNKGAYVLVRVNDGKYTVIMNDIKMLNADYPHDTVLVSSNIVEQ